METGLDEQSQSVVEAKPGAPAPGPAPAPNDIIKDMYLQINNLSQALNVGIFVVILATPGFYSAIQGSFFSTPFFFAANLFISVIFWARYYFDTEILKRSFTIFSVLWYFAYVISQGVSISLVGTPALWLASTGIFLFFGSGFYAINLVEIRGKTRAGILKLEADFIEWQRTRLVELLVASLMAFTGAYMVSDQPAIAFPAALIAVAIAMWQLWVTNDYRSKGYIETGR